MKYSVKYEVHSEFKQGYFEFCTLLEFPQVVEAIEHVPRPGAMVTLPVRPRSKGKPDESIELEVKHRHFHWPTAELTEVVLYVGHKMVPYVLPQH